MVLVTECQIAETNTNFISRLETWIGLKRVGCYLIKKKKKKKKKCYQFQCFVQFYSGNTHQSFSECKCQLETCWKSFCWNCIAQTQTYTGIWGERQRIKVNLDTRYWETLFSLQLFRIKFVWHFFVVVVVNVYVCLLCMVAFCLFCCFFDNLIIIIIIIIKIIIIKIDSCFSGPENHGRSMLDHIIIIMQTLRDIFLKEWTRKRNILVMEGRATKRNSVGYVYTLAFTWSKGRLKRDMGMIYTTPQEPRWVKLK